ncbi:arginyl-tRNA synthetase [Plasmodium falciparum IGH-CR14]|uniref:arginine--tRNA ligase n=1 Tax=Plasmodium falciparum IGH-CR14 TaxID=580059 RepID=A0A0L1IFW6_PLAFA|nr:arginyl-tRNA synthetase [Plasmodium falciparum IGH-CR14]
MYDADKEFEKSSKEMQLYYKIMMKIVNSYGTNYVKVESKLLTNIGDAICYQSENFKVPLFLQKSNGGYGYDSTDVAALYYRLTQLNCNCVIYVTDIGQLTHFETIFDLIKKTNWGDKNAKLMHVGFGFVLNEDNKKFKTRSGTTVKLINLIKEGTERAKRDLLQRIETKSEEEKSYFENVDIDQLSESLCVSAIKYFDLKQHRNSDYKFSYDNMLNVKGNTGIYIIYGYSRICSIFRKSTINVEDISKDELAEYMYDLTTTFTAFYENCKVLNNENEKSRLLLCSITKSLLKLCMELLGMKPIEKL